MKTFLTTLATVLLLAGSMTGCQSEEEKLAAKGCDCFGNEDKADVRECLDQMAVDEPRLKEDKDFGKKIEKMIKEKCPDVAEK